MTGTQEKLKQRTNLFGLKRIETAGFTRFKLCSLRQRSIQQETTVRVNSKEEEETIQSCCNRAPTTSKLNPDDINPLLFLLFKPVPPRNTRKQDQGGESSLLSLCSNSSLAKTERERERERVLTSVRHRYIEDTRKKTERGYSQDNKRITNLWPRFYLSSLFITKRKT